MTTVILSKSRCVCVIKPLLLTNVILCTLFTLFSFKINPKDMNGVHSFSECTKKSGFLVDWI